MQNNKNHAKHTIPWLLSIIAKMKLKGSAGLGLDAKPNSDLGQSEFGPLDSKSPPQGKNCTETTEGPSKTSGHQEGGQCVGGQNQETTETREYSVKELFSFCGSVSSTS